MILLLFNKYYTHAIIVKTAETTAASSNIAATLCYILSQALFLCRLWSGFTRRHATFFAFLLYSLLKYHHHPRCLCCCCTSMKLNSCWLVLVLLLFYIAYLLSFMLLLLMLLLSFCLCTQHFNTYIRTYTHGTTMCGLTPYTYK